MSSVVFTTDDLQISCPECNGVGESSQDEQRVPCVKCGGKGVILTGLGQTLLHFVKSHLD